MRSHTNNRLSTRIKPKMTRDENVVAYPRLAFDIDPGRAGGFVSSISATKAERRRGRAYRKVFLAAAKKIGLSPVCIEIDSGNGTQLFYDLPSMSLPEGHALAESLT